MITNQKFFRYFNNYMGISLLFIWITEQRILLSEKIFLVKNLYY